MSKKRWNYILLNGIGFELDMKNPATYETVGDYGDIREAYNRPSDRKMRIYDDWWFWFRQNNGNCAVASYNCNFFTICGYVTDNQTGKRYNCYITPAHNYCYEIIEG